MKRLALIAALLLCATQAHATDYLLASSEYHGLTTSSPVSSPPYSIFAHFNRLGAVPGAAPAIAGAHAADNSNYVYLLLDPGTAAFGISIAGPPGGFARADTTNTTTAGTWHTGLGIMTSATDRVSVLDGDWANRGTSAASHAPTFTRTAIGVRLGSGVDSYFNGSIAYVTFWDVALTEADSDALAAGQHPLMVKRESIVAFYACFGDGPVGTRVRDRMVGSKHLTTVGGTPTKGDLPPIRGPSPQYGHLDHPRIFRPWTPGHAYRRDGYALAA